MKAWLTERMPVDWPSVKLHLQEQLPVYLKHFWWALGGTPMILLVFMIFTGLLLTMHYVPHPNFARESIVDITYQVRYGWLIRGIHATSANLMVFSVLLHLTRVYFTRAYRRPREFTWMTGVILLFAVLGLAFTGYSLVYDQMAYWATTVGTSFLAALPYVGDGLLWLLRGGVSVNPDTLLRFYSLHISVLPAFLVIVLALHVVFIRLHGVSIPEGDHERKTYPLFPDHVMKELTIAIVLLTGIVCWNILYPPIVGDPADLGNTPAHIRPEWYFYPSFRWLKIVPLQVGLWSTLVFITGAFFWPFVEEWIGKLGSRFTRTTTLGFYTGAIAYFTMLLLLVIETIAD